LPESFVGLNAGANRTVTGVKGRLQDCNPYFATKRDFK
jgi:hypothetical protein